MLDDPEQLRDAESAYREAISQNPGKASMDNGLGNVLYAQGRWSEAEAAYRKAIRIDPTYANAHCGLGDALRRSGRAGQAEAAYREAIGLDPDNFRAYRGLGLALCDESRFDEAEEAYRNAIRLKPDDANSHHGLGDALQALGRSGDAEAEFRNAVRLNPADASARLGLGNALRVLGRLGDAGEAYRRAIDLSPREAAGWNALGDVLREAGQLEEAAAAYRDAVRVDPRSGHALRGLGHALLALGSSLTARDAFRAAITLDPEDGSAHTGLGDALRALGRLRDAEEQYRTAIRLSPDAVTAYVHLGSLLRYMSFDRRAADAYLAAVLQAPDNADARVGLDDALEAVGAEPVTVTPDDRAAYASFRDDLRAAGLVQPDQVNALTAYRRAVLLKLALAWDYRDLGDALRSLGRADEAAAEYSAALLAADDDPDNSGLVGDIANSLAELGQHELAETAYRRAIDLAEGASAAHVGFARFLQTRERFDEAVAAYREALAAEVEADPTRPDAFDLLADLARELQNLGRHNEAEGAIRTVIDLAPDLEWPYISLGEVLEELERFDEAIDAYREAIDLGPADDTLSEVADELLRLGASLREMNRADDAAEAYRAAADAYRAAIEADPESATARCSLGDLLRETERPDEAASEYLAAIELDPGCVSAHNGLGLARLDLRSFGAAAEAFREAIRLQAGDSILHANLGSALCLDRRFEEAEGILTEAIRLDPGNAYAHDCLGDARQPQGRLADAALAYHQAIRLNPDLESAHDGLDSVLRELAAQPYPEPQPAGPVEPAEAVEPAGPAGPFTDDLRALAFWYASVGVAEVPLLGTYVPEGLPDGLVKKRARLLELSALDVLPASPGEVSIAALLEAELRRLEDRDRTIEILRRRTCAGEPETLDAIGKSWGVTRERVRQIESKALTQLVPTLNANTPLGVAVAAARRLIGTVLPLSDLLRLLPALADEIGSVGQPAWRVLSALDDAYEIEDGWCASPAVQDAKAATGTWLQEHANKHGVADMSGFTLLHASQHVALPEEATRDWLAYCGYEAFEDWIFTRTSTIGDRVAAMLSVIGSPLSAQELLDHEPESRSLSSLRNAMGMDERFERVDRDAWALSEWGLEPYNGIRDQIHQELARSGGEISMDLLIERIAGQYSVAESSVRAYAGAPPFESSSGLVRFATGERASSKTLTSTRRLYLREDAWLYRVKITGEHLRGSGSVAPVALATQVGLQRGSSCRLNSALGPQLFSWASLQPAFGTIQRFLTERNVVAGQQVFLVIGHDLSFDIWPIDADRTNPVTTALSLTGAGTVDAAQSWPALARAIGLPEDSPGPSIIAGYRDRGDTDVADLLQATRT